jgi:ATP-dependent Lhr-like helicase
MSVESPGAVSRGLQRVGRAGHQVGGTSRGVIWPKHRGDLLEAVVVADGMRAGRIEPLAIPRLPLDVLAQQIVACAALDAWEVPALFALLRRAAPYRALSRDVLDSVLDLLAGRYPSTEFAELRARIVWDRTRDRIEGRPGSRPLALISGGTIPDRGLYAVFRGEGGPRLGELDEEMVHETRVGERITLGASTWRVDAITRDRVLVSPAPGEVGKLPFWRGDGPGRPFELGRALGAFARELAERCEQADREANARELLFDWLAREHGLDRHAAQNLVAWIAEQRAGTGVVASDRALCVERFRDELGDWRVCIHSPFGARVHAPWALAIEQGLGAERAATAASLWSDDGLVFRFADADEVPRLAALFPDPERLQERVTQALATSSLLAASFREAAARALLLPRRGLGRRTPLWVQRLRSQQLLAVAQRYPEFPILLEAYRECLQDRCDLSALQSILRDIREGRIEVREVETARPSPAARALAFEYTAAYLYQGDLPVAERRAQALSLDREALRELLGQEELRSLLDPAAIDAVERELQGLDSERRVASAGALHDLLRRVGELTPRELRERSSGDPDAWLEELERSGRALALEIAGERRYAAAEDAALYRDALEVALPEGLPAALLAPRPDAITELALRFARTHGPFEASRLGARFGLSEGEARAVLEAAVKRERLVAGELLPGGRAREYADPESLRRVKRRSLARLRAAVEPVDAACYARFLLRRHGIGEVRRGSARLAEALDQLAGLALPFGELEAALLPARVAAYEARQLDELIAQGRYAWIGRGALAQRELPIAFMPRESIATPPDVLPETPLEARLLEVLSARGASFFSEICAELRGVSEGELLAALHALAERGLATNDSLAPLRARMRARSAAAPRSRRLRGAAAPSPYGGRWSRIGARSGRAEEVSAASGSGLRFLQRRVEQMLARWGVIARAAAEFESIEGGFAALAEWLGALEERGALRRGNFVEGFAGAQYAEAGAVDRLRDERRQSERGEARLLAATDPAQPYGAVLDWPDARTGGRARRALGCRVVLVDGEPAFFAERGAQRLLSFPRGLHSDRQRGAALGALCGIPARGGLRVAEIDGEPALRSPLARELLVLGFRSDYKGLVFDGPPASAAPASIAGTTASE